MKSAVEVSSYQSKTIYPILMIISISHLLNDTLQSVVPAMFPILESSLGLTFTQLGFIYFSLNLVASIMQPLIGMYTDKRPIPYALPIGLMFSLIGMLGLAFSPNFLTILLSVIFIGIGSATFHPEGSRVAFLAAGSRRGFAQSIFQVGGNAGQALAPMITALVLVPLGQFGAIWFTLVAFLAVIFLFYIANWYKQQIETTKRNDHKIIRDIKKKAPKRALKIAIILLVFFVFVRSWYHSAMASFYAFYAMDTYGVTIAQAQFFIFIFLLAGVIGTFIGGPIADRIGRRNVILLSLLIPAPLAMMLPFVHYTIALALLSIIGLFIMASFSVTVVYAQELVPGKIGTMAGLIVGLAFGMGAVGSIVFGTMIDMLGLSITMIVVSLLPLLGIVSFFLPHDDVVYRWYH